MRISHKEKLQLGYSNPPHSLSRDPNSDIDFSDVFGGPPRRASMQEGQGRHYDEDGANTWRGDGDGDEEMVRGRRSLSSNPRGNPVFGDEMGTRRRYPSQDFFDDIFRGDKCQSSSPRMGGRDPSSSCPGSRVLSPVRALPPGAVPLGSPAQFSLPARLTSTHSSSTSMSRLSGGDAFSAYRRSPLSHKGSAEGEELRKDVKVDGSGGGTLAPDGGNQFHFSIHKWASKGMPLVMSLGKRHSLRSKIQLERSLSLNGEAELPSDTLVGEIQPAGVNDDCLAFKVHVVSAATKESDQIVDKSVTDAPKSSPKIEVEDGNTPVEVISYFAAESQDPANSVNSTSKEVKDVSKPDLNANKSDLKQSSTKLHEKKGRSGNDSAIPEVRINKRVVKKISETSSDADKNEGGEEVGKSKLKEKSIFKRDSKRNNGNHHKNLSNDTAREKIKESIANDRDKEKVKGDKDGSKGKVKEFVKIFNQEPSPKPTADAVVGKSPSSTWRNSEEPRASSKSTPSSSKTDGKLQGYDVNYSRVDPSPKEDGNHMPSSGKQFEANNVQESCQSSSTETENLGSTTGSTSDRFKASRSSIDVGFESFVIEELPEVQDKTSENREDNEELRAYESKILTWSKGKEGNIRALLSTLQYVLWPNSGWKPVPLVDIIEANAVKRSYQRALLYLHPDKLQQKGAAVHQKFIAEKVFDILQEAWDHFNTLGSL